MKEHVQIHSLLNLCKTSFRNDMSNFVIFDKSPPSLHELAAPEVSQ